MQPMRHIQRFPWGTADDAQVLIVHFGSKSTPMGNVNWLITHNKRKTIREQGR